MGDSLPRKKLAQSPLILVLCEIRFAPVLAIESKLPALQESLRSNGFPGLEIGSVQQVQVSEGLPRFTQLPRWVFHNKERTKFLALGLSSLSFQVLEYDRFESYLEDLRIAVEAVATAVGPAYAERVGLRYVDAIPEVGSDIDRFFKETVLSFRAEQLGVESLLSTQLVIAKTARGRLTVRMAQVENESLLSADLHAPELASIAMPRPGVHAILDIDSSDEGQSDFSWADLSDRLWGVHQHASAAFWESITEEAQSEWGASELRD